MNSRAIYAVIALLALVISAVNATGGFGDSLDFVRTGSSSLFSGCEGSIAECIAEEEEMEFDSDISRRILAQKKYVSYGAMRKNSVPCSRRGASYYNCQRGAQANPYRRGCSTITRCRRWRGRRWWVQFLFCPCVFRFIFFFLIYFRDIWVWFTHWWKL